MSHRCKCRACRPHEFPEELRSLERTDERHFSVRFGDERYQPCINGQRAEHVTECMTGEQGWVVGFLFTQDGRYHPCACGSDRMCEITAYGEVTVIDVSQRSKQR